MTRVVIVGAGHNGLVAAIRLAAAGLDVTVLEHAPRIGGATASVESTLPGYVHDHCATFVPTAAVSPAIQALELERDGLEWIVPDVVAAHPFDDGSAIALHRDVAATAESLGPAGAAWSAAMRRLVPLAGEFARSILSPLPPVRDPLKLAFALRRGGVEWVRRLVGSVEALGLDVFDGDRRATAWLAGSAQHSGLPPDAAGSGAFGLLLQTLGHSHGWPFPRGGMQQLADALARRARREGAEIRCDASVQAILVRGRRTTGVRLAGGETVDADAVLTTVSAGLLARLLPADALPARLYRRLQVWRYGTAPFMVHYALDRPVPWAAEAPRRAAVVHVAGALEDLARAAQAGQRGEVPARTTLVVGQHSLHDPTRAPEGGAALYVYGHVPSSPDVPDDEIADRIQAQLERFAPGFGSTVRARALRSPAQTERENPSLIGGDLAGGSMELDQLLVFRPAPELSRYRTPVHGLYVAGASVHPGAAVHGVTGRGAAQALLNDRVRRPWRRP
jgi:phytoene dehydrogenase-like protein